MAKIIGEAGQCPSGQALINHRRVLVAGLVAFTVLGAIVGIVIGQIVPIGKLTSTEVMASGTVLLVAAIGTGIYSMKKMDVFELDRRSMRKGADGETRVGNILGDFPESFRIINGLVTPFGDLDHIVIGPTGVFVVDSKNWRGVVSSDETGELLVNGKPTTKATIRPIVSRTMDAKEKIQAHCDFELPYFQVVLAFTSAWVEARWGTTGKALCVTDEGLYDLIVEHKNGGKLDGHQLDAIAQAFMALAPMDKDFEC
ncbi:MAG TPA: nuclease-related domain-containing protein [Opitutaceae bacterium]